MNTLQRQQLKTSIQKHFPNMAQDDEINIEELKRAINFMQKKQGQQKPSTKLLLHCLNSNSHAHQIHEHQYITSQELQQKIDNLMPTQFMKDPMTLGVLFQLLDSDKDGLINIDDFKIYLDSIGSTMQHAQIQQFFQLMTPEGTHLTKQQFAIILSHM